jgi:hypothetical protein
LIVFNLHIILAPIVIFMSVGSFILNPPMFYGALTIFQFIRGVLLLLDIPPYDKKFLISLVVFYITPIMATVTEHWKRGNVERTNFIKINPLVGVNRCDPIEKTFY